MFTLYFIAVSDYSKEGCENLPDGTYPLRNLTQYIVCTNQTDSTFSCSSQEIFSTAKRVCLPLKNITKGLKILYILYYQSIRLLLLCALLLPPQRAKRARRSIIAGKIAEMNLRFSWCLFVAQDYSVSYLFRINAESKTPVVALIFRLLLTFVCWSCDFIKKWSCWIKGRQ